MITIFMFYEKLEYLINLSNLVITANSNIQILGFGNGLTKFGIKFCKYYKPDVIISDNKFKISLDVYLDYKHLNLNIFNADIHTINIICNRLKILSLNTYHSHKLDSSNYKRNTFNELLSLRFNPSLCGTKYLLDCIAFAKENPYSRVSQKKFTDYFGWLSYKYRTPTQTIVWNIRTSIGDMYRIIEFRKFRNKIELFFTYQSVINSFRLF